MTGSTRSSAELDERRKRILFRAWHRGTREMDLLMGRFTDAFVATMADSDLDIMEALLDEPDPVLSDWITGVSGIPSGENSDLLARLRDFHSRGPVTT